MLEKLGFQQLVEETLTVKRATRAMPMYQFVLAMVWRFTLVFAIESFAVFEAGADVDRNSESAAAAAAVYLLRFMASLPVNVAGQVLKIQRSMRQRCGSGARAVGRGDLDTDTTVHTLFGQQMGARKSYNRSTRAKRAISRS